MLSFVLCIGPLARLTPRFKPFLYNRRHLGVLTFVIALVHGALVLLWYHGFGDLNPLVSLLVSNPRYDSLQGFPFESLGLVALCLLFVLAATSHDFWNANLGPRLWKALHMSVYVAYALLVAHVALGAMLYEDHPLYWLVLALGPGTVAGLQLVHRILRLGPGRSRRRHCRAGCGSARHYDIPDQRATVVETAAAQRIAVFRLRRQGQRRVQRLPPPGRAAGRGPHRRRLHHLPVARLPVPARRRLLARALQRAHRHLCHAHRTRRGLCPPPGAAARHLRGTVAHRAGTPMNDQRNDDEAFFIGWADTPQADRRFFLRAGLGLMAGTAALGAGLAALQRPPGPGAWNPDDVREWRGHVSAAPYAMLRTPRARPRRATHCAAVVPGQVRRGRADRRAGGPAGGGHRQPDPARRGIR